MSGEGSAAVAIPPVTIPSSPPGAVVSSTVGVTPSKKAAAGSDKSSPPIPVSTLKKLFAVALFFSLVFLYVFFANVNHDPHWWKHAGIHEETKPPHAVHPEVMKHAMEKVPDPETDSHLLKKTRQSREDALREKFNIPVNGSAFYADYDVGAIQPLDDPPLSKEHPTYKFKYARNSSKYTIHYLSAQPMVGWIPNFLTDDECDAIVAEASKSFARSQVVPYKDAKDKNTLSEVRTSSQTWMATTHPVAAPVINRIMDMAGFPAGSSEMLQILKYEKGQKYDAHLDYFDPKLYGAQTTNRAVTVFIYLSTVEEGGYTQFPRANGKPPTWDFKSCKAGLKVRPVKGTIAFFYDMKPNGEYDDYSLHGGCKPVVGTKYGGTLWLRVPV